MTEQSVIWALLLVALVWRLAVYWRLFVREWPGCTAWYIGNIMQMKAFARDNRDSFLLAGLVQIGRR